MSKCIECNREMTQTEQCNHPFIKLGFTTVRRDTSYYDIGEKCHDCGIVNKSGNLHHLGCDMELCPICNGQLISCGCWEKLGLLNDFKAVKEA